MNRTLLLVLCYVAFVISSLLVYLFGDSGWSSFRTLAREAERLRANTQSLRQVHTRLIQRLDSLDSRAETVRLLARELGYFRSGEYVVHVDTYGVRPTFYRVGTLVRVSAVQERAGKAAGGTAYFLPLLLLVSVAAAPRRRGRADDAPAHRVGQDARRPAGGGSI